ncbi:REP element-mobilizing transposase RayT [Xylanibacter ruminicola]|uniref:REP element-mobilizing transposase RayT n=2 Tax=Xylanibacter ruminicola TaxID=839 RepID=A0A1H4C8Q7_XYLRU|nr:REP element-mobilizing transposase RayT [Xylanibacter ruminicola]
MPRQSRKPSGTGIYHVMMRGINHQNIFEEQEDYYQFLKTLDLMALSYEPDGTPAGRNYTLYAYCLMPNHIHLLIREREDTIGMAIKRIASSYAYYYNHKYSRDGHLFRERFKSEPVNDMAYFVTLLRYIHQNPVKAGMVEAVGDYEFSSWGEYMDKNGTLFPLCDTCTILNRLSYNELNELVNASLSDDVACLDVEDVSKGRPSDDQVMSLIKEKTGVTNSSAFQQLPADIKKSVLIELKNRRASLRQLERLTGIGKSMIYRLK